MKIISRVIIAGFICVGFIQKSMAQITLSIGSQAVCFVGDSITVPVNVTSFTAVGTFSIKILYDPAVVIFGRTLNWNPSFTGVIQGNNSTTGTLAESWIFETLPVTIADGKLFDIRFASLGGTSNVSFSTNPGDNEVTDDNGIPYTISNFSAGEAKQSFPSPVITGSLSYCTGTNTTLNAGSFASYLWSNNASTQTITVTSGTYSVTVTDVKGCTGSSANAVVVEKAKSVFTQTLVKCPGFSVTVGNNTYTTTGVYNDVLVNANGCDSTVTTNLTIKNASTGTDVHSACGSYTWLDGNTYTSSNNTATDTLINSAGCDSVITLNLTISTGTTSSKTDSACGNYLWNGNNYSVSGIYQDTIPNSNGCDSVMTLNLTIKNNTSSSKTDTACAMYSWNGNTYSASGIYFDTIPNSIGCDSVMTLNLTINNPDSGSESVTDCISYTWAADGNTYDSSGIYTATLTGAKGCDSIATLQLTITSGSDSTYNETACVSYTWQGNVLTASGIYTDSLSCGGILTLNLTINNSTSSVETDTACGSYSWNGNTYSASGTYLDTIPNASGCDSLMTIILTIKNNTSSFQTAAACGSYSWNGNTYSASGIYYDTIPNTNGCDSSMILNLTIKNSTSGSESITECNSFLWAADGNTYTSDGTYTATLTGVNGCDSTAILNLTISLGNDTTYYETACNSFNWQGNILYSSGIYTDTLSCGAVLTLNLTINNSTSSSQTATACESYFWNGNTYSVSGNYLDTIPNASGCDSLMTLNLTIKNHTSSSQTATSCGSFSWNGNSYSASGIYFDTIPNANGCDSLMTLNLTIKNSTSGSESVTVCGSYLWAADSNTYSSSGTYTAILTGANGCDSNAVLNLIISNGNDTTYYETACNSYTWQGNMLTSSGIYTDTLSCGAVLTLDLTINNSSSSSQMVAACGSYSWNGNTYSASGTYLDTITNANGCDSLMTLNLTINNPTSGSESVTACNSYLWAADGNSYSTTGTYTATLIGANGCDSTATLNLTISAGNDSVYTETACNSFSWQGNTYTTSGTYTDTLPCGAVLTLNLTINPDPDITVTNNSPSLSSNQTGAIYEWIDCLNNTTTGQTNQTFIAPANGNYAVVVTLGNCSDTSACEMINNVKVDEQYYTGRNEIYPNPNEGTFEILIPQRARVVISDLVGKEIFETDFNSGLQKIQLPKESGGVYFVWIKINEGEVYKKMVVNK